jgi:hypothetical protein
MFHRPPFITRRHCRSTRRLLSPSNVFEEVPLTWCVPVFLVPFPFLHLTSPSFSATITSPSAPALLQSMEPGPGSSWIERDTNGLRKFVRKRRNPSSRRSMLADAFGGESNNPFARSKLQTRSRSFSRVASKHRSSTQAPVRNPNLLALTAPPPPTTTKSPHATMNTGPENANGFIHDTGQYSQPPLLNDPNQHLPYPQYPSVAPPYPAYYLAPAPVPAPPPFPEPYPPLPPGARLLSPPRAATADDLKYKCSICGRYRSPRFHYKHPIPPGQFPAQTVCRKCRQAGTDSEDTSDEQPRVRVIRRSRSIVSIAEPPRARIVSDVDGRVLRRRPSRVEFAPRSRSRSRHRGRHRRHSVSPSSSLDLDELRIVDEEGHRRRGRSRSVARVVERVRYIEESPPVRVSPPRETIYIEDEGPMRPRRASRYEEDYYTDYDSEGDYVPRRCVEHVHGLGSLCFANLYFTLTQAHHIKETIIGSCPSPTVLRTCCPRACAC